MRALCTGSLRPGEKSRMPDGDTLVVGFVRLDSLWFVYSLLLDLLGQVPLQKGKRVKCSLEGVRCDKCCKVCCRCSLNHSPGQYYLVLLEHEVVEEFRQPEVSLRPKLVRLHQLDHRSLLDFLVCSHCLTDLPVRHLLHSLHQQSYR